MSPTVFHALLPCRSDPSGPPVTINLALWESNYYRYTGSMHHKWQRLQVRHVYLRYQDTPHRNSTFEIDDSAIHKRGFTYSATWPEELIAGNMVTLSTTDPLCVKSYSSSQEYDDFAVGFGQCFGQNWTHVVCIEPDSHLGTLWSCYGSMLDSAPVHAQSMNKARSGAARYQVFILQNRLPRSNWLLQTSCVMWKSSRICGIKLDVFWDPYFSNLSGGWTGFDVDVSLYTHITISLALILQLGNRRSQS